MCFTDKDKPKYQATSACVARACCHLGWLQLSSLVPGFMSYGLPTMLRLQDFNNNSNIYSCIKWEKV